MSDLSRVQSETLSDKLYSTRRGTDFIKGPENRGKKRSLLPHATRAAANYQFRWICLKQQSEWKSKYVSKYPKILDDSKFVKIKKIFLPRLLKNVSGSKPKMSLYHISKSNKKKENLTNGTKSSLV